MSKLRWLVGVLVAGVLALAIAWALFVPAADWLAHHDVGSVKGSLHETALDNARGWLLTLGAGLFAAAALVFAARNFTLSRRMLELTEQRQVTERYIKAVEQLGSKEPEARIGGIYALERVARDSARDYPVVIEVLTAFIREHSHEQRPLPDPDGQGRHRRLPPDVHAALISEHSLEQRPPPEPGRDQARWTRPDVQAAATVIGRRDQSRDQERGIGRIDLSGANLAGADLTQAGLSKANLFGAVFTRTRLDGAMLNGANLGGSVLAHACLRSAILTGADLTGADLAGADLAGARLNGTALVGANLTGARLCDADLEGATLHDARIDGANLTTAKLTRADVTGVTPRRRDPQRHHVAKGCGSSGRLEA